MVRPTSDTVTSVVERSGRWTKFGGKDLSLDLFLEVRKGVDAYLNRPIGGVNCLDVGNQPR